MNSSQIIEILKKRMPIGLFDQMISLIKKESEINSDYQYLFNKFIFPKIRQYGLKVEIKIRPIVFRKGDLYNRFRLDDKLFDYLLPKIMKEYNLDLEQINKLDYENKTILVNDYLIKHNKLEKINHYGLWIGNQIYHWGPNLDNHQWKIYGENETDREITKNWYLDPKNEQIYFTIRSREEINQWVGDWEKNNQFDLEKCNSKTFAKELVNFLHLY